RGVDDVDVRALVFNGTVLGQNRNAALFFEVIRVHDPFRNRLIFAEGAGLTQQLVDQGSFTVIDVGNNGDVAQGASHSGSFKVGVAGSRPAGNSFNASKACLGSGMACKASSVTARSSENGPTCVRRNAVRWAWQPSTRPMSWARVRMYVPLLQATSISACVPDSDSRSMRWMVTWRAGRSSSMPWRAYSYSGLPSRLSAEYIGGTCSMMPWKRDSASRRLASSTAKPSGARATTLPVRSPESVSSPNCSVARYEIGRASCRERV